MRGGSQAFAKPCHGVPQEQEPGILLRGRVEVEVIRQTETQGRKDLLLARPGRLPRRMDTMYDVPFSRPYKEESKGRRSASGVASEAALRNIARDRASTCREKPDTGCSSRPAMET